MNRITSATDNTGNYNVSNITYDKMGNIETLTRQGAVVAQPELGTPDHFGAMDILDYDYNSGNKLLKVSDTGNSTYGFKDGANQPVEYTYDGNGNMKSDANKGITSISYNHLNMPTEVVFNNNPNTRIEFVYDAEGIKQRKITNDNGSITTTDYAGNHVYENGSLVQFGHPEGYVEPDSSRGYHYIYNYLDHLGTVRLTYSDHNGDGSIDPITEIVQERNTYPFGLSHKGYNGNINGRENNYQTYLGQEINKELGLDWLTFRYRNYMPEIGRFFGVDPISEEFFSISTYQFAHNNAIWKIELEGLEGQETSGNDIVNREPVTYITEIDGQLVTFQTRRVYVRDFTVVSTGNGGYSAFDNGGNYQTRVKSSDAGSNNWYGDTEYNYTVYEQGANESITISTQSERSTTVPGLIKEKYNPIDENKVRALEDTGGSLESIGENGVVAATVARTPVGIGLTQAVSLTGSLLQSVSDAERNNYGDIAKKGVTETVLEVGGNVVERQVQNKAKSNWILGAYEFISNLIDKAINE